MSLLKRIGRHPRTQAAAGRLLASWLGFVARTNRFTTEPADAQERVGPLMPVIAAMWHGQHFLVHLAKRPQDPTACLVSRSGDGELNAIALTHLGVRPIRGSGDRGRGKARQKGGALAMRAMLRALEGGETIVMTADVPKIARRAGPGIVTLARLSGRPIVPVAVVTSRHHVFDSWDRATLALPFGRGAIVIGEPIRVDREADEAALEAARRAVEDGLDGVHARAYALVGRRDPGADLRPAAAAPLVEGAG